MGTNRDRLRCRNQSVKRRPPLHHRLATDDAVSSPMIEAGGSRCRSQVCRGLGDRFHDQSTTCHEDPRPAKGCPLSTDATPARLSGTEHADTMLLVAGGANDHHGRRQHHHAHHHHVTRCPTRPVPWRPSRRRSPTNPPAIEPGDEPSSDRGATSRTSTNISANHEGWRVRRPRRVDGEGDTARTGRTMPNVEDDVATGGGDTEAAIGEVLLGSIRCR